MVDHVPSPFDNVSHSPRELPHPKSWPLKLTQFQDTSKKGSQGVAQWGSLPSLAIPVTPGQRLEADDPRIEDEPGM